MDKQASQIDKSFKFIPKSELKIEKYPIGQGSFGVIKEAFYKDERTALKITHLGNGMEEVEVHSRLRNPHIIKFIGVILEDSQPNFIQTSFLLQYAAKGTLRKFVKVNKVSFEGEKRFIINTDEMSVTVDVILLQITRGMVYLHGMGIVHRDLAARNILLTSHFNAKIADFGFSKSLGKYGETRNYDDEEKPNIPFRHHPKESLCGIQDPTTASTFSKATDVWSFGVVVWEVFNSGEIPYSELGRMDVVKEVCNGGNPLSFHKNGRTSERFDLDLMMNECFQQDPASRPDFNSLESDLVIQRKMSELLHPSKFDLSTTRRVSVCREIVTHKAPIEVKPYYNCGKPYPLFVGRDEELHHMKNCFEHPATNLIVVTGLAGVGRTEIVRKFCNDIHKEEHISCLWLLAASASTLNSYLERVATELSLSFTKGESCRNMFRSILKQLGRTIVVFDNLDERVVEVEEILVEFLEDEQSPFLVVISRDVTMLQEFSPTLIAVETLSLQSAVLYVGTALDLDMSLEKVEIEVKKLCSILQCYTLGLRQAVAFIKSERHLRPKGKESSVSDYLEKLGCKENLPFFNYFDHDYKRSLLGTICVTLDHILKEHGSVIGSVLRLIACLPLNTIEVGKLISLHNYFLQKQNLPPDNHAVQGSIKMLKSFGFVELDNSFLNVQRMVQEVCRVYFKSNFWEDMEILFRGKGSDEKIFFEYSDAIVSVIFSEYENKNMLPFIKNHWFFFLEVVGSCGKNLLQITKCYHILNGFLEVVKKAFGSVCHPNIIKLIYFSLPKTFHWEFATLCDDLWTECFYSADTIYIRLFAEIETTFLSFPNVGSEEAHNPQALKPEKVQLYETYFEYFISFSGFNGSIKWEDEFHFLNCITEIVGDWFRDLRNWKDCLRWRERGYKLWKKRFSLFKNIFNANYITKYLKTLVQFGFRDEACLILKANEEIWMHCTVWQHLEVLFSIVVVTEGVNLSDCLGVNGEDLFQQALLEMRNCWSGRLSTVDCIFTRQLQDLRALLHLHFKLFSLLALRELSLLHELITIVDSISDSKKEVSTKLLCCHVKNMLLSII